METPGARAPGQEDTAARGVDGTPVAASTLRAGAVAFTPSPTSAAGMTAADYDDMLVRVRAEVQATKAAMGGRARDGRRLSTATEGSMSQGPSAVLTSWQPFRQQFFFFDYKLGKIENLIYL